MQGPEFSQTQHRRKKNKKKIAERPNKATLIRSQPVQISGKTVMQRSNMYIFLGQTVWYFLLSFFNYIFIF